MSRRCYAPLDAQFECDLTAALLAVSPSGLFRECLDTELLIAPVIGDFAGQA
jgi:hypothetical protein